MRQHTPDETFVTMLFHNDILFNLLILFFNGIFQWDFSMEYAVQSEKYTVLNSHPCAWRWSARMEKFYMQCFYNFHAIFPVGRATVNTATYERLMRNKRFLGRSIYSRQHLYHQHCHQHRCPRIADYVTCHDT